MKSPKVLFFFLLISCSSSKVIIDFDEKTNFNQYKTYAFFADAGKGLNEFDIKRSLDALYKELDALGFKEVENPDFYINIISKTTEARVTNTLAIGVGSGGRNGGFGVSGGIPIGGKKLDEELILEFVDANSNELFWEATLISTIKEKRNPEERVLYFKEVIKKMLNNYPPK
ncbi:DUF4136 domain-containing protein [Polaribacter sargassicola]|uniref:DUF4136 domain-containing protein n=1 Tax=Polaribacter sargassicola TaxID=2836891 RepID=UPI001F193028|nr:DUF4136 domain-containing protein [Polaribacter sp. DS7-9]MCG1035732.1 DUF4136 domain-containing protein [Polaribacter sp. DS7-9]